MTMIINIVYFQFHRVDLMPVVSRGEAVRPSAKWQLTS